MVTSGNLDVMGVWNQIELDDLELQTDGVRLRPWRPEDAARVVQIMRDEQMSRYLPLPRPYTEADAWAYVTGFATQGRHTGTRIECAVEAAGIVVAAAGLQLPVGGHVPEIGYWVATDQWGRGYATRATRALATFGFDHGLTRIEIRVDVANVASAATALRAGFQFEGVLRQSNRSQHGLADHALFARLATDSGEPVRPRFPRLAEISDGTVTLRPVRAEDWPVILAENANPEQQRWGFGNVLTETEARQRTASAGLLWLTGRGAELLIVDSASGQGAGTISLRPAGPPNVAGIGYGVLPEFRGRRFTTRALRLLSEWAFSQTDIVRLELGCKVGNVASARSAVRAGFVRDARYGARLISPDGSYADEIGFGLLKPT